MKSTQENRELREQSIDQLKEKRVSLQEEFMRLSIKNKSRQLTKTSELGRVKRTIARLSTVIKELELIASKTN